MATTPYLTEEIKQYMKAHKATYFNKQLYFYLPKD